MSEPSGLPTPSTGHAAKWVSPYWETAAELERRGRSAHGLASGLINDLGKEVQYSYTYSAPVVSSWFRGRARPDPDTASQLARHVVRRLGIRDGDRDWSWASEFSEFFTLAASEAWNPAYRQALDALSIPIGRLASLAGMGYLELARKLAADDLDDQLLSRLQHLATTGSEQARAKAESSLDALAAQLAERGVEDPDGFIVTLLASLADPLADGTVDEREAATDLFIGDVVIEALAQATHRLYTETIDREHDDAALESWADLIPDFRDSNRDQTRSVLTHVERLGLEVVPHQDATETEFDPADVEFLAEVEHRRWVNERLEAGWKLGARREPSQRTSPYLVDWDLLDDSARSIDRQLIRNIPAVLGQVGLGIRRRTDPA